MVYYKVNQNAPRVKQNGSVDGSEFLVGELYTVRELGKFKNGKACTVPVEIPKNKVTFVFGARVQVQD